MTMLNVVFTGPAFDNAGHAVVRADLIEACKATGKFAVQSAVKPNTDLLVASRTDTVKAKAAAAKGLEVITYPQFIRSFLSNVELKTGAKPNRYTDQVDHDLLVPAFGNLTLDMFEVL
jgi:hypothetical protein